LHSLKAQKTKPGELYAGRVGKKLCNVFSLAGFVTRPQSEIQIGAVEPENLTRRSVGCQPAGEGVRGQE
jgi:hypothetical protein